MALACSYRENLGLFSHASFQSSKLQLHGKRRIEEVFAKFGEGWSNNILATDRHIQVATMMKKDKPHNY